MSDTAAVLEPLVIDVLRKLGFEREQKFYSVRQICELLQFKQSKVYGMINSGTLMARKLDGKTVILKADLDLYIANLPLVAIDAESRLARSQRYDNRPQPEDGEDGVQPE